MSASAPPLLSASSHGASNGSKGSPSSSLPAPAVATPRRSRRSRIVTGLDIGTTKICAIIGRLEDDGQLTILGVGSNPSVGLKKGMVVDIEATVDSIQKAVRKAEDMADTRVKEVYVGIAGGHIQSHNTKGVVEVQNPVRGVSEADRNRAIEKAKDFVKPRDQEVIHFLPQEWVCDGQPGIRNPVGMSCSTLEVRCHMVLAAITSATNIVKCCQLASLATKDIVLESLASSHAILTEQEKDLGVLLIDIGGGTSDVAVFSGGSVKFSGVIPVGGDAISNDVAYGLKVSRIDAENLKKKHAHAMPEMVDPEEAIEITELLKQERASVPRRFLCDVAEARLEQIFMMAKQRVDASPAKDKVFGGIVLTGGSSLMPGITALAERVFETPAKVGTPTGLKGMSGIVSSPIYSTGVGLVLHGLSAEPSNDAFYANGSLWRRMLYNLKRFIEWYA